MTKNIKALIIDDNEDLLYLLKTKLNKFNIDSVTATLGEEGLQKIEQHAPDIILLDLKLPKMSGVGFLNEYKSRFPSSAIPVVVLTSMHDSEVFQEVIKNGATACLTKSCSDEELLEVIQSSCACSPSEI